MVENNPGGRYDPTEEAAAIRRLTQAGHLNEDDLTSGIAFVRLVQLAAENGFDPTDPTIQYLIGNPDADLPE